MGQVSGGLKDLNDVRKRAGLRALSIDNPEELLLAIERERRLEFAFEPHRWFDLVRTGRIGDVLGVTNQNRWVMPLPVNEIQASGGVLVQNEGY
jgi:hypothetical protein